MPTEPNVSDIQTKLKVGDTVHWSDVNSRSDTLSSDRVTKVGSKLVTVGRRTFRLDTLTTNDSMGHQTLVLDVEAYYDQKKADKLSRMILKHLLSNKISLPMLMFIADKLGVPA